MTTITLADAIARFDVDVLDHLDRQFEIPVLSGPQRQGDVIILPRDHKPATTPVGRGGYPVVKGESGGNTHLLLPDGDVRFDPRPASATSLTLGTLTVGAGATGWLAHPEHGYVGIAPGTYEVRRQREQADVLRLVTD